jgi:hypothetical protein
LVPARITPTPDNSLMLTRHYVFSVVAGGVTTIIVAWALAISFVPALLPVLDQDTIDFRAINNTAHARASIRTRDLGPDSFEMTTVSVFGWPWIALRYSEIMVRLPNGQFNVTAEGQLLLPIEQSTIEGKRKIALPIRPVLFGFLGNWWLFASWWFALQWLVLRAKSVVRHKRHKCLRCGYSLRGSHGCPECGWNRPESERAAGSEMASPEPIEESRNGYALADATRCRPASHCCTTSVETEPSCAN